MKLIKVPTLILLGISLMLGHLHAQKESDPVPESNQINAAPKVLKDKAPDIPPVNPLPEQNREGNIINDNGSLIIKASGFRPRPVPVFYSARAESSVNVNSSGWNANSTVTFEVIQGEVKELILDLIGDGDIINVNGDGILDWAVRQSIIDGKKKRHLEIRPKSKSGIITAEISASKKWNNLPDKIELITLGPAKAVGYSSLISLTSDRTVDLTITSAEGLVPVKTATKKDRTWKFQGHGTNALTLGMRRGGTSLPPVGLNNISISGSVDKTMTSAAFVITGTAQVSEQKGGTIELLSGHAALSTLPVDENYFVKMRPGTDKANPLYEMNFKGPGSFPFRVEFQAGLIKKGDWFTLDFKIPSGSVVPVSITGLDNEVSFDPGKIVFPTKNQDNWVGFLPANGHCSVAWKKASSSEEGKLFFASDAQIETSVGAGLLRQTTTLNLSLLQGKLNGLSILVEGVGEILTVEGSNVLDWTLNNEGDGRILNITSARPVSDSDKLIIKSQTALGEFPLKVEPLRFTPQDAVRHSGFVRISNEGAVRINVSGVNGLIQTTADKFPGPNLKDSKQIIVYQFPSSKHNYQINVDQILPEISVSQIVIYELTESDRIISAQIELDIREAPIREWGLIIPSGYDLASLTGAEVADYVVGTGPENGTRSLKALFGKAVSGRQLIQIRLTRKMTADPGEWELPYLNYQDAKSVRGHVGVKSVPGYRITTGNINQLAEIPQAYFPVRVEGLQQTFRLRDREWSAKVNIEALDQNVQADVFHLYSLKEGIAYGSVLLNYFVVGAPVSEWRLAIPPEIGNIVIDGHNVRDWTRDSEKNLVIVSLHQPTLGAATLLLTFEQPMNARGGSLFPGKVSPVGVQGERGYIQIVSPSQVKHEITTQSSGLLKMEPLELPAEFKLLSNSPSLAVFQYSARPFELKMQTDWFEQGKTLEQVVDFATLNSHVSSDGQIVTTALFLVKTRGSKALRIKLPEGINLWDTKVNQKTVNARNSGDITLIPLSASLDPNTPVEVTLNLGQESGKKRRPLILAPTVLSPTLTTNWNITADPGQLLIPVGKNTPVMTTPALTQSGFEWIQTKGINKLIIIMILTVIGSLIVSKAKGILSFQAIGLMILGLSILTGLFSAEQAMRERRVNVSKLEFVLPVLDSGEEVQIGVRNIPSWESMISWSGLAIMAMGILMTGASIIFRRKGWWQSVLKDRINPVWFNALAWVLILAGILSQHAGAGIFFLLVSFLIYTGAIHSNMINWFKSLISRALERKERILASKAASKERTEVPDPVSVKRKRASKVTRKKKPKGPATGGAVSTIIAISLLGWFLGKTDQALADHHDRPLTADQIIQKVTIKEGRLYGTLSLTANGEVDDTVILLDEPAVLTHFKGNGLRVTKQVNGDKFSYMMVIEREGNVTCECSYELAGPDPLKEFTLPTSSAATHDLELRLDQSGWEFYSDAAVRTEPVQGLQATESGARMMLGLQGRGAKITLKPQTRDTSSEKAEFTAESSNLFVPGPGLVDGLHKVTVRPSRGQIRQMQFKVPVTFTVSNVTSENLSNWRFDPETQSLRVEFSPAHKAPFNVSIMTQKDIGSLPAEMNLGPVSVTDSQREFGMIGIAFGQDAQPGNISVEGMSKVNPDDFDPELIGSINKTKVNNKPTHVLHQAYRYQGNGGTMTANVTPVSPEVRVTTSQTLSIGNERLVLAIDMEVNITRAGLFKLSFTIPQGLEIESASGPSLSHWTESTENEQRIITLNLSGRTLGAQSFSISIAGPAPGALDEWKVPRISLLEATRQNGQLLIVPEQGIRVQTLNRNHVQPKDARSLTGNRPGTLAFGLLQADWDLSISIESLDPWVTSQVLHEVTLREGLTKTRLTIDYRVENAAVKSLRLRLPTLEPGQEKTVRATGSSVSDIVKVEGEESEGLWEIQFKRRILGSAKVEINYQKTTERKDNLETVTTAKLENVGQSSYWVAVRVSGHFEISTDTTDRGWNQIDWSSIPKALLDPRDRSVAALTYRAVEPDKPLSVKVQRHAVAQALSLRVSSADFRTIFSTNGTSITESEMQVDVVAKSTMKVKLPQNAVLINTFVNGQSAAIVKENDSYLFYVHPREDRAVATVSLVWSMTSDRSFKNFKLQGPSLNVPLQNITWRVVLPQGYELINESGTLDLQKSKSIPLKGISTYRDTYWARNNARANDASIDLQNANRWKNEGDQAKARSAYQRLSNINVLDEAANEDARVQLRKLQTEQAVVGLNTRRQRFYLDNRVEDPVFTRNQKLEQAADVNPLLQGNLNYNPNQVDTLLQGNTKEENDALKNIASRIVGQQLAAEPALQALDVTLLEHGNVLTFNRSVQVDGNAPLELDLIIARESKANWLFSALILLAIGAVVRYCKTVKI
ncbi:MAG: hypothetical protein P8I97_13995 [Verrucomicrobiales bacterium]|nr:hypothetical protein [Verrucomicrobiales bacterium]